MPAHPIRAILAVTGAAATAYLLVRRPWLRSGASTSEVRAPLPGDDLLNENENEVELQATRAVTIEASADEVWPWLVQMGHGRAGWYSIDRWDNAGEPSADRIIPELQHLKEGESISDATGPFGFTVARLIPEGALVLRATIHPVTGRPVDPADTDPRAVGYAKAFLDFTWSFVLAPVHERRTRLLVRVRYRHQRSPWVRTMVHGYEVVDTLFSRRMLAGIKQRAERRD